MNELMNTVPGEMTRDINIVTAEIRTLWNSALESELSYAVKLGRKLTEAKALLEHGEWGSWVKENLPFSQDKASMMMRIYENYGANQESLFGEINSETFRNLGISQAFALLSVPENEREDFVKETRADEMSVRELKEAIKERDAAKAAAEKEKEEKEALLAENLELSQKAESAEKAEKEKEDALARMTAAQQEEAKAKEALKKAKEAEKAAKDKLAEAKANPEIPEAKRKEISEKAAAEAKADAAKAVADAEQKLKRANAELMAAQQQLKMTNPDVAEFGVYFRQVQEDFNRLCGKLIMIRNTDTETGNKCTQAVKAAVQKFMDNLLGGKE